jgi:hypothetical protein
MIGTTIPFDPETMEMRNGYVVAKVLTDAEKQAQADAWIAARKAWRAAAKPMNFSGTHPVGPVLYDGISAAVAFERYSANMRTEGVPEWLLTAAQKQAAQVYWKAELARKTEESAKTDAGRVVRVVVDRDLDEVE